MNQTNQDNQLTLHELVHKGKEVAAYVKNKWLLLVGALIIGSVIGICYALFKKNQYKASLSFVLAEQGGGGGGLSAYAGIASQFGIDLGGVGESSSLFQGDNILEFIRSQRMITQTLLSKVDLEGEQVVLANRYAMASGFRADWDEESQLKDFSFAATALPSGNPLQDSLIQVLYRHIVKKSLTVVKPDKKLNIIQVSTKSTDELFAKTFTEQLIHRVMNFYVETKTKKEQDNLNILTHQVDSVRKALYAAIGGVAAATDANPNPNRALQQLGVSSQRRRVDVQANSAILEELVKNQELAKISLRKEMPILQIIDRPILPLESDVMGPIKGALIGAFLLVFLTASALIARVLLKSIH